jgi:hypothetical protein
MPLSYGYICRKIKLKISCLRKSHSGDVRPAERRLLTNFPVHGKAPSSAAVLGDSGLVDGYMRYTAGTWNPLELLRLGVEIRRFRPDVLI